jgi:nucleoside 2-deoxyribosyltransferase
MKVYVGSSLFNTIRVRQIQERFRLAGIGISYDWSKHGQVYNEAELARIGDLEERGVKDCDLFFMIQPARNGTHCEMGLARAWGKPIVILEEIEVEQKTFYYRPGVYRCKTEDEAFNLALRLLEGKEL